MEVRWGNINTLYHRILSGDTKKFILWICSGIIVPLILVPLFFQFYINPTIKNKTEMQEEIIILKRNIRNLFFRDEETFRFCAENKNIKIPNYATALEKINQKRDDAFENLVSYTLDIFDHNILDEDRYKIIKEFTQWNNTLYLSHQHVCAKALKNPAQLKQWRDSIMIKTL